LKKLLFIAVLILLFLAACSEETVKIDGEATNYEDLQVKIKEAEKELGGMEKELTATNSDLEDINEQVKAAKGKLESNQTKFDKLQELAKNREQIKTDVDKATTTLKTLKTNIDKATEKLQTVSGKVTKAEGAPIELGAGHFVIGEDLKPGRYKVTPTGGSGNFFVRSDDYNRDVGVTLGNYDGAQPSYVFEAVSGDKIEIGTSAKFTPVK